MGIVEIKMEESNGSEKSKEWHNIYNIVKQIPRKEVNCDAVDAPSAATMIEQLFLNLGNVNLHSQLNLAELKKEFEKLFMVTDRTEMIGTAVNAKLNDIFKWIEQKVKHDYSQLPTNEEIELWAMRTYKEYEEARWFEPLKIGAMWMRDLVMSNSNIPKGAMDINTVKEIIKLCTVLHDSPDAGIEEASGIDLVRMQLEDVLIKLKEKKK